MWRKGMTCLGFGVLVLAVVYVGVARDLAGSREGGYRAGPVAATETSIEGPVRVMIDPSMRFEPNRGQAPDAARFLARQAKATVLLMPAEVAVVPPPEAPATGARSSGSGSEERRNGTGRTPHLSSPGERGESASGTIFRIRFVGADPDAPVTGEAELASRSNYFVGSDRGRWQVGVPHFARVRYEELYPGIDLVLYGNRGRLQYDLVVEPAADPGVVRLAFEGVRKTALDQDGRLLLSTPHGDVVQTAPYIYQQIDGARHEIEGGFRLLPSGEVGFTVEDYDRKAPLVIDPVLVYSTLIGGIGDDSGHGIAVDASGHIYVAGQATNVFPTTTGAFQEAYGGSFEAFITKFSADGSSLVYSTYLGGGNVDVASHLAIDGSGNAYVTGLTGSTDFPTVAAIQGSLGGGIEGVQDGFVAKLDPTGSTLLYSTYLGGSGQDQARGIAASADGRPTLTGYTRSTDFPTANAFQAVPGSPSSDDAFVARLDAAGSSLEFSTYLGGTFADRGWAVAVDPAGNAYVTGVTVSSDFPTQHAVDPGGGPPGEAFVTMLSASGTASIYSTYLGGAAAEETGFGIALGADGSAYVVGETASSDFPTKNALQATYGGGAKDVFVSKLIANGSDFAYSTFIGGGFSETANDVAVDDTGSAYIAGSVTTVATAAFLRKLSPAGTAQLFAEFLGGGGETIANAVAVDGRRSAYITGDTDSTDFETVRPFQSSLTGFSDAFVSKYVSPLDFFIAGRSGRGSLSVAGDSSSDRE